jgi:hypothetical protein
VSQIVIVSGPPGAGKSTACEALCERYDRTVHLLTDEAYGWIRMGYIEPWKPDARDQNEIVSTACARAAVTFAKAEYGVFIDGVVRPLLLQVYLDVLKEARVPVHYAVLKRIPGASPETYVRLHALFTADPLPGLVLDTTSMTGAQAADAVMDACGRGTALVWAP